MTMGFHDGSRSLQDRFDTRNLADRIDGLLVGDTFDDDDRSFIQERDMFFLATADAEGRPPRGTGSLGSGQRSQPADRPPSAHARRFTGG